MALKSRRDDKTWRDFIQFSFITITSGVLCLTLFAAGEPFCYVLESMIESNGHIKTRSAYFKRVECDGSPKICERFASRKDIDWVESLNSPCIQQEEYSVPPEEHPKCPSPLDYRTDTTYYYRYLEIPISTERIDFKMKANNDVHIALSPSESSSDLYEIVIGGWGNTQSAIRRCQHCTTRTAVATDHYLSANNFRKFWITFGSNGAVAVGRNDESTPFMEWTDPDPLDTQYLGYSTGWGSTGEFRFCSLG